MGRTLTYLIEIAVGLACFVAAGDGWRRSKVLAGVFVVAGLAAVGHGIYALAT